MKILTFILLIFFHGLTWSQSKTELQLSTVSRDVPLVGYNLNSLTKPSWYNQSFVENSKTLGVEILRYPGGTVSQYFDWQTGETVPNELWQNGTLFNFEYLSQVPTVPHRLNDLQQGLQLLESEPIFALNMVTQDLPNQINMLNQAQQLGIPVKYIELSNELYFEKQDFVNQYPTPEDYALAIKEEWIPALRTAFPEAKIIMTGGYDGATNLNNKENPARIKQWNSALLAADIPADGITYHYYFPPNTTTLAEPKIDEVLAAPFKHWPELKTNTLENTPQFPAYITEYNMNDGSATNYAIATSWGHGLYTATCFTLMLESPLIKMLLNHQVTGNPSYASLNSYTHQGDTIENKITAEGTAMGMLHRLAMNKTTAVKFQFSNNPLVNPGGSASGTSYQSLLGWYFTNDQVQEGYVINLSSQSFELDVSSVFNSDVQYQQVTHSNPLQKALTKDDLQISNSISFGKIILPAYSLTSINDQITITSLNKEKDNEFFIHPNPARQSIGIYSENEIIRIQIIDLQGKEQISLYEPDLSKPMSIVGLNPGVYFLKASLQNGVQISSRFLKLP